MKGPNTYVANVSKKNKNVFLVKKKKKGIKNIYNAAKDKTKLKQNLVWYITLIAKTATGLTLGKRNNIWQKYCTYIHKKSVKFSSDINNIAKIYL